MTNTLRYIFALLCLTALSLPSRAGTDTLDPEGYPVLYVRGDCSGGWSANADFKFTRTADTYTITLPSLDGLFKIAGDDWQYNLGGKESLTLTDAATFTGIQDGANLRAANLSNVTITLTPTFADGTMQPTVIRLSANGHAAPDPDDPIIPDDPVISNVKPSGTLPVLYINVYNEGTTTLNNEIIDRNLDHKNYFTGEYWLDCGDQTELLGIGIKSIGSKDEPLPLEIKARGNWTRKGFAKKPFKLKLGAKQALLGLSKSKHFAILAHADDTWGFMRNFTGFYLGRHIGLPWTPWQQPCEVVINGDYRGLYFLTESIRVEKDRINITSLDDEVSDPALISGGYLVELDNYDEENQIRMYEKTCVQLPLVDMLRITWDTPELYSQLQQRFVGDQFTAMNDAVGACSNDLWSYMDLDDAARYYIVEEMISHTESYHGSTYLFRDRGEGEKWHFSPLWDCGNAFSGPNNGYFYDHTAFGNTWIPSMRANATFNDKVKATYRWFMGTGIMDSYRADAKAYYEMLTGATNTDYARWNGAPRPDYPGAQDIVDNRNTGRAKNAIQHLENKVNWLNQQWGYSASQTYTEPEHDTTPAAPLPPYAKEMPSYTVYFVDDDAVNPWATPIYAYIWDQTSPDYTSGTYEPLGSWKGTEMQPTTLFGKDAWMLTFFTEYQLGEGAKIIFNNGGSGDGNQTESLPIADGTIYHRSGKMSDVDLPTADTDVTPAEYYNLQGIRVDRPTPGSLYIVNGKKVIF